MLPGEEFAIERWYRSGRDLVSSLATSSASTGSKIKSTLTPPSGDGAVWWCNPQAVSALLLGLITLLLLLRFGGDAKAAPRKIVRRFRRRTTRPIKQKKLLFNRPPIFRLNGPQGRLLFNRPPLIRGMRERRVSSDYASARDLVTQHLSTMVGLGGIKQHLASLLDTLEMDQRRSAQMPGYTATRACMHMVFLGNPGTGKTAVAQLVARVLSEIGVLRTGQLVVAKKADLLGRYSNHVSRNTRAMVESALGGVLLLDEAYALLQGEAELGREVLNVLVDLCYAYRGDLVVILAGCAT